MERLAHRHKMLLTGFLSVIFILSVKGSDWQTFVCSSSSASEPLSCTSKQWVRIVSEIYAPQTGHGTTCQQNMSTCNAYFYDTGMLTNCNGPAKGGDCREEVDVHAARLVTPCLRDVLDVATLIQYSCIEGSSVLNLCDANVTLWTSNLPLYLASPGYVQSTPVAKMCTCAIQGSDLKMNAVQINVISTLPWREDATDGDVYSDVFSVTSGSTDLWRSGYCAGCETNNLVNSNLFLPVDGIHYQNVSITYSDFGMSGQNVWLEIFESGPNISVSCRSTPLPPDKVITTSSTAAATSASTSHRPTPSHTLTTTPHAQSTNTPLVDTVVVPNTKLPTTEPTSPLSTSEYSKTTDIRHLNSEKQKDSNDETILIVTLTVVMFVLIAIAVFLGILIYRKRHILKSDDYISPWVLVASWWHRRFQEKQPHSARQDGCSHEDFDSVLEQDKPHQQHACKSVSHVHSSEKPPADNTGPAQDCEHVSRNDNSSLIPAELYQLHQQLLDEELDKMRRERSSKANLKMSTNVPLAACLGNSRPLDENKLQESDTERTPNNAHGSASEKTSMHVPTSRALMPARNRHTYVDHIDTSDSSDDDIHSNTSNDSRNASLDAETHSTDKDHLSSGEHRLFEALGISTDAQIHDARDRRITSTSTPLSCDYKSSKDSTGREDNMRTSDLENKLVSRSHDGESSCKDHEFLEAGTFFDNNRASSPPSQHLPGRKISKPDIVSDIIEKCQRDIKSRRNELDLHTTHNTGSLDTGVKEERRTKVQTSEC